MAPQATTRPLGAHRLAGLDVASWPLFSSRLALVRRRARVCALRRVFAVARRLTESWAGSRVPTPLPRVASVTYTYLVQQALNAYPQEMPTGRVRIGELSRRVGVSRELLRAWERRYGLLDPARSPGGMRLYSEEDERRIHAVRGHMSRGLSAGEAARLAKAGAAPELVEGSERGELGDVARSLREVLERFDSPDDGGRPQREHGLANLALESALAALGVGVRSRDIESARAVREVVIPQLRRLGWVSAEASTLGGFLFGLALGRVIAARKGSGDRSLGPRERRFDDPG